jgi:hypothetical protein
VLSGKLRVEESRGNGFIPSLLCDFIFFFFSKRVFSVGNLLAFSLVDLLLNYFVESCIILHDVMLLVGVVPLFVLQSKVDVVFKVLLFKSFPGVSIVPNGLESKFNLILGVFSVLTESVETNDELTFASLERGILKFFPSFSLSFEWLSVFNLFLLDLILLLFPLRLLKVLVGVQLVDLSIVLKSEVEGLLEHA